MGTSYLDSPMLYVSENTVVLFLMQVVYFYMMHSDEIIKFHAAFPTLLDKLLSQNWTVSTEDDCKISHEYLYVYDCEASWTADIF